MRTNAVVRLLDGSFLHIKSHRGVRGLQIDEMWLFGEKTEKVKLLAEDSVPAFGDRTVKINFIP